MAPECLRPGEPARLHWFDSDEYGRRTLVALQDIESLFEVVTVAVVECYDERVARHGPPGFHERDHVLQRPEPIVTTNVADVGFEVSSRDHDVWAQPSPPAFQALMNKICASSV